MKWAYVYTDEIVKSFRCIIILLMTTTSHLSTHKYSCMRGLFIYELLNSTDTETFQIERKHSVSPFKIYV